MSKMQLKQFVTFPIPDGRGASNSCVENTLFLDQRSDQMLKKRGHIIHVSIFRKPSTDHHLTFREKQEHVIQVLKASRLIPSSSLRQNRSSNDSI